MEYNSNYAIEIHGLCFKYNNSTILDTINLNIEKRSVVTILGKSGCGKSTLLKCINRMNDYCTSSEISGNIFVNGEDIYDKKMNVTILRAKVGMVFQKPSPFFKSIYENVEYGPKIHRIRKEKIPHIVEKCLKNVYLWDDVKDKLHESAYNLSGGQQQRLCIARTLAVSPQIILMDEPCSALDPESSQKINELILELKKKHTIVVVTHSTEQASIISDFIVKMEGGNIIKQGSASDILK